MLLSHFKRPARRLLGGLATLSGGDFAASSLLFSAVYAAALFGALGCGSTDGTAVGDAGATDPPSPPSNGGTVADAGNGDMPSYFLFVTDSHVGDNTCTASGTAVVPLDNLRTFLNKVAPAFPRAIVINGGDLVDNGRFPDDWQGYYSAIMAQKVLNGDWVADPAQTAAPGYPWYMEIVGNHDVKFDDYNSTKDGCNILAPSATPFCKGYNMCCNGYNMWAKYTATGPNGRSGVEAIPMSTSSSTVRVVRADTAASTSTSATTNNSENIGGVFDDVQASALSSSYNGGSCSSRNCWTVVVAHHPYKGSALEQKVAPDSSTPMGRLLDAVRPRIYFAGHTHVSNLQWFDNDRGDRILQVTGQGFGKYGNKYTPDIPSGCKVSSTEVPQCTDYTAANTTVVLASLDHDQDRSVVVAAVTRPFDPANGLSWPVVFITSPGDRYLGDPDRHTANGVYKTQKWKEPHTLRVLAFARPGQRIKAVACHIDYTGDVALEQPQPSQEPAIWSKAFNAPGTMLGSDQDIKCIATDSDGNAGTATITIRVGL